MKNRHTNKELDLLQLLSIFVCLGGAGCGSGGGGTITFVWHPVADVSFVPGC